MTDAQEPGKSSRNNGRNPQHSQETYRSFLGSFSYLERFLLFMAKTELFVLQYCTRSTRMTLSSVGGMVVITGILAFSSSFFAIRNSFFFEQPGVAALLIPLLVASVYAAAIMAFDREIVAATDKRAAWLRIPFAFLIGLVISFPVELQLQHGAVVAEINKIAEARSKDKYDEIDKLEKGKAALVDDIIKPLKDKVKSLEKLRDQERQSMEWESQPEHGLCRGRCEEHRRNAESYQQEIDQINAQVKQEEKNLDSDKRIVEAKSQIEGLKSEIGKDKQRSHDLLSQAVALHSIYSDHDKGPTAMMLGWFLRIFFVCFELFPVLIKMTMPYTEYHAYLEARNRLIVTKLIGASNHKLQEFREHPDRILGDDTEVTDMLVDLIEDRAVDVNKHRERPYV